MSDTQLPVEARQGTGKGYTRKLRATGRIPGVCYSSTMEATPIQLDAAELDRKLRKSAAGMNTLFDLQGGGLDGKTVLVKELQRDPVRGELLHADLFAIDVRKTVEVAVPVHVVGTAVGVRLEGGILDFPLREIEVSCLPRSIPEEFTLDVSELGLGDSLHVRDVPLPDGVELLSDPDLTLVSVVAPTKAEEEAAPSEEALAAGAEGAPAEDAGDATSAEDAKSDGD